jgi:aryl-alcohol dehydrogenase-like predicted oxidoreductase
LAQVEQAIEQADIVCVQNAYSLIDQKDLAVLDRCQESGVAYVPYFPLGSACPHMPEVTENPVVLRVAQRVDASRAQVGLAWLLVHRDNILLIHGTSRVAHLQENMDIASVELSDYDIAELDRSV